MHWIVHERELYHRVTRKAVAQRASELVNEQSLKASRGWVDKFLKRHSFVIRERTTTGQRLPPELGEKVGNFVLHCQKQREQLHLHPSDVGETAIWADMPGQSTVEVRGARHVPILTTGHEKSRITVCLAAMADSRKLQPLVVFKGKRMPQELKKVTGVHIALTHNGWMQVNTTVEWISKVWGSLSFRNRLLVWDSYRCHLTVEARQTLKKVKTTMACIPGSCTKLVQPADVSWNQPFKAAYRERYERWLQTERREDDVTPSGNPRAPSKSI